MQWDVAALVNGPDCSGEWLLTCPTFVEARTGALPLHEARLIDNATVRARRAVRPADCLKMFAGCIFIVKDWVCEV